MIAHGLFYKRTANIHEVVLQDVHPSTLSEFSQRFKAIIEETPEGEIIRLLIYVPAVPSIQYILGMARDIKAAYPNAPQLRMAGIYVPSLQLSLLNMVVRAIVRSSTLKLFLKKDEHEARQWLSK